MGAALTRVVTERPFGQTDDDLFSSHRLAALHNPGGRQLIERHFPAVGPTERNHPQHPLPNAARQVQIVADALTLAVGGDHRARFGVEHNHSDWRYVYQGLQIRFDTPFCFEFARVRDRGRRMRGEFRDDVFIIRGEFFSAFGFRQVYVTDVHLVTADWHTQESPHRRVPVGKSDRLGMAGNIGDPQRALDFVQVAQQPLALRGGLDAVEFALGPAGGEYILDFSGRREGQKHSIPSFGEPTRVVNHPLQDNLGFQTFRNMQACF